MAKLKIEDVIKKLEELSIIFGNSDADGGGWWYESRLDELIDEIKRGMEK